MTLVLFYAAIFLACMIRHKVSIHVGILLLSVLLSMRNDLVPDTIPYKEMYMINSTQESNKEVLFLYLCHFFNNILGLSFSQFLFIITFFSGEIWLFVTKKIVKTQNYGWLFICYISFFGLYYHGIVLRAALAIIVCYVGMPYMLKQDLRGYIIFIGLVMLAFFFHKTSIFYLLTFLGLLKFQNWFLYGLIILAVIFDIIHPFASVQKQLESMFLIVEDAGEFGRFAGYIENESRSVGVDFIHLSYMVIALFGIKMRNKIVGSNAEIKTYNFFLNLYVLGIVTYALLLDFRAAARIPAYWLCFEFIVVYFMLFRNNNKLIYTYRLPLLAIICIAKFILLVHRTPMILSY